MDPRFEIYNTVKIVMEKCNEYIFYIPNLIHLF